jgi:hypothetical protein
MKRIALALFIAAISAPAFAQTLASNTPSQFTVVANENAAFKWVETSFDFGKIPAGTPASHEFTFTNTGDTPLVISSVKASCGCTVAAYSKDSIAPGAKGFVKATYNAANVGLFTKTVTVNANTQEGVVVLTIRGEVVQAAAQ